MTRWRRSDHVLWRMVLDDVVLLSTEGSEEPFVLAGGCRLWESLADERHLEELTQILGADDMGQDLVALLSSLVKVGVVERTER